MRTRLPVFVLAVAFALPPSHAQEVPREGAARLAAIRKQLLNTVSKFEFTQGYDFRKQPEKLRPLMEAIRAKGFDTWDQMPRTDYVWDEASFVDLERTLEVADKVGLKVWATLVPPTESEKIVQMPLAARQQHFYSVAERFAQIAAKHPHFVAFTCDDFDYNVSFFTPQMLAEMTRRYRAICPRLAFVPLSYYGGVSKGFFTKYGNYVDGIVFHFRTDSYPPGVIPAYDATNFEMYGDAMRYELKRVREMAAEHLVICGIYIGCKEHGGGSADDQRPPTGCRTSGPGRRPEGGNRPSARRRPPGLWPGNRSRILSRHGRTGRPLARRRRRMGPTARRSRIAPGPLARTTRWRILGNIAAIRQRTRGPVGEDRPLVSLGDTARSGTGKVRSGEGGGSISAPGRFSIDDASLVARITGRVRARRRNHAAGICAGLVAG